MSAPPKTAMVLAAGLGTRMGPLTEETPKPLLKVGGRALLDHLLDRLATAGIETAVVNVHYLAAKIEQHLASRGTPAIAFSHEEERLETGGGIARALPLLGPDPFFAVNADILWLNGPGSALDRLSAAWSDGQMDGLLLLHSTVEAYGYDGGGDFLIDPAGILQRRPEREVVPYLFTGVQILHPRLFAEAPEGAFSLNLLYDRAMARGRLHGIVHDGEWFHVGTPAGLAEAESYLSQRHQESRHR